MKIIAIDLAGVCRRFFELDKTGSLSDGSALAASIQYITRAADGFDRVVVARDIRPSFRHSVCPTYKQGREDPGPVYAKLETDVLERMYLDGASIFPNKKEAEQIKIGDGYPEADDIIASFAFWFSETAAGASLEELVIASEDSDLCALVSDERHVSIRRFDGTIWREADVLEKIGYGPDLVREVKALAGDTADRYKPFPHHEPAAEGGKTKPGIGPKSAVELLSKWGRYGDQALGLSMAERVLLAAQDGVLCDRGEAAKIDAPNPGMPDCHERRCLVAGGAVALKMGYQCATLLDQLPLHFDRVLKEPVKRSLSAPKDAPIPTPETSQKPAAGPSQAPLAVRSSDTLQKPRRDRNQIERYALQPRSFDALQDSAKLLYDARIFPQFDSWQGVAGAIWIAAEQGLGVGQALRGTYVVKGKHAYSAALMVALVKREKSCLLFRLVQRESDDKKAVVEFQKNDMAEPDRYTFTWDMAERMGVTRARRSNEPTKWETQPHLMLAWAAYRECARLHWPEVVAGMYTPDELRAGKDLADAEFDQTDRDMDGEVVS